MAQASPNWDSLLGRAWDTLDGQLERKNERKLHGRDADNERYRDITSRQDDERDDANDLIELRGQLSNSRYKDTRSFDNDRFRDVSDRNDGIRDDGRDLLDLNLSDKRKSFELNTERASGLRDDKRRSYQAQTDRKAQQSSDDRNMLKDRGKVFQSAFESRRGDTIITRIMTPLAIAAGIGGAIYLFQKGQA